jgi:sphingomyelin synthase-related protein 1
MLVFAQYCYSAHPTKNKMLLACVRYCIYLIWFVGVIAIVGTKLHYTLDVFLAIFLTITTWNVYHDAIKYDALKQNYRVLKWLESEVIGEIDDEAFSNFQKKIQ